LVHTIIFQILIGSAQFSLDQTVGMINAHVRDAVAVIGFAAEMEEIMLGKLFFFYILYIKGMKGKSDFEEGL
jgi:hypothetical protein